jgi:hypothetical protein
MQEQPRWTTLRPNPVTETPSVPQRHAGVAGLAPLVASNQPEDKLDQMQCA